MAINTFYDLLRPASFDGVPFFVKEDTATFGRNVSNHEFIQRDKNYVEDLGRKTRDFKFNGWIVANQENAFNPFINRDALIERAEKGGYGRLIHPFYGEMRGVLHKVTVKQQTTENGGLVGLEFEFLEGGEKEIKAVAIVDSVGKTRDAIGMCYGKNAAEFASAFSVQNTQGFVLDDAYDMLNQFKENLKNVRKNLGLVAQVASGNLGALEIFRTPLVLANEIQSIVKDIGQTAGFKDYSRPSVPNTFTPARVKQHGNQNAFVNLIRNAAVIREAELALLVVTDRSEANQELGVPQLYTRLELNDYRRNLAYLITGQLLTLSSLGIYSETQAALLLLRTEIINHLSRVGENLGTNFFTSCEDGTNFNVYMPTIPLVYKHYGELRYDEFNARNKVRNPLFNPPNAVMELLNG